MLDRLPSYRMPDGSIVHAGRINKVVGGQAHVSSAPLDKLASLSSGYYLVRVPLDPDWKFPAKPEPGKVLVIGRQVLDVVEPQAFEGTLHGAVKPPVPS